jgi:hypothetical protein
MFIRQLLTIQPGRLAMGTILFYLACGFNSNAFATVPNPLEGRWDLTITMPDTITMSEKEQPSWLEIRHSGDSTIVGHFVCVSGSSRPISEIKVDGNEFSFSIPRQWEKGDGDLSMKGILNGETLSGTIVFPNGKNYTWTGVRAPAMRETKKIVTTKAIKLIQPDLKGWHASGEKNQWVVADGILKSPKKGVNLITDEKFTDFKLHAEFRVPKNGNSGIYLRGRYELQIADSKGKEPLPVEFGGIYGFISPSQQVALAAGEWQTYDITLVGRMITIVANGITVATNQEIPGITGGALDSKEGTAGPIMLQGDHEPIEFRNIVITPIK